MRSFFKIFIPSLILFVVVLFCLVFSLLDDSKTFKRVKFEALKVNYKSFDDILKRPQKIQIETFKTGKGTFQKDQLIRTDSNEKIEVSVLSHLIKHDVFGNFLIDAGLDSSFQKSSQGRVTGLFAKNVLINLTQDKDQNIASVLKSRNLIVKGVFFTHLHYDQIAGISDLTNDLKYFAGKNEQFLNINIFLHNDYLKNIKVLKEFDFKNAVELKPMGKCIDIFGDGSLLAISTPGHTKNHVSYFVNGEKEQVLITGDAIILKHGLEKGTLPGKYTADKNKAIESIKKIQEFIRKYPRIRLIVGHEI